jgi:hypothetical protein
MIYIICAFILGVHIGQEYNVWSIRELIKKAANALQKDDSEEKIQNNLGFFGKNFTKDLITSFMNIFWSKKKK